MGYRIRRSLKLFPSRFYFNVACAHLPRPDLKKRVLYDVDGSILPLISVDTGRS